MTSRVRGMAVSAALAFAAGLAGVFIGREAFIQPPQRPPGLHEVVHRGLRLDARQEQRIAQLERDFAARRAALEAEMRAANVDLAAAIRDEHGYGPRVTAAVDRFHGAMGALQTETIAHVFAMRAVLTPAQQVRFDESVAAALTAPAR